MIRRHALWHPGSLCHKRGPRVLPMAPVTFCAEKAGAGQHGQTALRGERLVRRSSGRPLEAGKRGASGRHREHTDGIRRRNAAGANAAAPGLPRMAAQKGCQQRHAGLLYGVGRMLSSGVGPPASASASLSLRGTVKAVFSDPADTILGSLPAMGMQSCRSTSSTR